MKKFISKEASDFIGGFICCVGCMVILYFIVAVFG